MPGSSFCPVALVARLVCCYPLPGSLPARWVARVVPPASRTYSQIGLCCPQPTHQTFQICTMLYLGLLN